MTLKLYLYVFLSNFLIFFYWDYFPPTVQSNGRVQVVVVFGVQIGNDLFKDIIVLSVNPNCTPVIVQMGFRQLKTNCWAQRYISYV